MYRIAEPVASFLVSLFLVASLGLLVACGTDPGSGANNGNGANSNEGGSNVTTNTLTGTPAELIPQLYEKANAHLGAGEEFAMMLEDPITKDNCEYILGLTPAQFEQYVEDATSSAAAISTIAHLVAIVQCKNADDAKTVMGLIATGHDPARLICVFPQQCFVLTSGDYVLLVASSNINAEALKAGFSDLAEGNVGSANVFFTYAEEEGVPGGGELLPM